MKNAFDRIALIGKYGDPGVGGTVDKLIAILEKRGVEVVLEEHTATAIKTSGYTIETLQDIGSDCDLAITVGGDGTLLNAARNMINSNVPLLGINLGRLGFLVDVSPDELDARMEEILNGKYEEEHRILLNTRIEHHEGGADSVSDAFNDVVVHIRDVARMIEFETRINDEFVNHQRADGIVVSTPTGSTAYALSSGGPILHATLDAITLVPISPHTLSSRPLVINADSQIKILICNTKDGIAQATCDGHLSTDVHVGDHIKIKRKADNITLLHPNQHSYFEILRAKLHWSEHS